MSNEDGHHSEYASEYKLLLENPTTALWLAELKLVLSGESNTRRWTMEHLGDFGEYCEQVIMQSADTEKSRTALVSAIDQLLTQYNPEEEKANKELCWNIFSLIHHFTPPSGFDWAVRMLNTLGIPDPKIHENQTGLEDLHLQALHALGKYFFRLPSNEEDEVEVDEEGYAKKIFIPQTPDKLATYRAILQSYIESSAPSYAGYAQRVLKELDNDTHTL